MKLGNVSFLDVVAILILFLVKNVSSLRSIEEIDIPMGLERARSAITAESLKFDNSRHKNEVARNVTCFKLEQVPHPESQDKRKKEQSRKKETRNRSQGRQKISGKKKARNKDNRGKKNSNKNNTNSIQRSANSQFVGTFSSLEEALADAIKREMARISTERTHIVTSPPFNLQPPIPSNDPISEKIQLLKKALEKHRQANALQKTATHQQSTAVKLLLKAIQIQDRVEDDY